MNNSVYPINKGINRPLEFKGLKAQYIGFLAGGLVLLLLLFAILYLCGLQVYVCVGLIGILGAGLFRTVFGLSARYGQHGLLKRLARRGIPDYLMGRSRGVFTKLNLRSCQRP